MSGLGDAANALAGRVGDALQPPPPATPKGQSWDTLRAGRDQVIAQQKAAAAKTTAGTTSGLDAAMQAHADKIHPVPQLRTAPQE